MTTVTEMPNVNALLGSLSGTITRAFSDMETAEDEIESACRAAPLHLRPLLFGSFLLLQPQIDMPALLYRAHCRELLSRVACGGDLDAPTVGEIGTAIYEMTLVSPMRPVIGGLYMQIVREAAPREYRRARLHESPFRFHEEWPGQLAETRAEIARHIAKRLQPRAQPKPRSPGGQRLETMERVGIIFPKEGDMHTLYTIGYAGLNPEDFRRWVEREQALVVDTRMNAYSPRPPFSKHGLTKSLGARYRHVPQLGNVNYKNGGPIQLKDAAEGYRVVLEALAAQPVVLLCGCKDLEACHRKYIADALVPSIGGSAVHLTPEDLRPAALAGDVISPPADDVDADLTQRGLFSRRDDVLVNPRDEQPKLL